MVPHNSESRGKADAYMLVIEMSLNRSRGGKLQHYQKL